jgi:hypothetical protein
MNAFVDLAADLKHADDFLSADALVLRRVAAEELMRAAAASEELMAGYVGDTDALESLRSHFRARRFRETVAIFDSLQYPQRLSHVYRTMVEIARRRAGG